MVASVCSFVVASMRRAPNGAAKGRAGRPRRFDEAAGCAGFPAVLGLAARRLTRCTHCVRCAQTGGGKSDHDARVPRAGRKPCAPRRFIGAPRAARTALCRTSDGMPPARRPPAVQRGRRGPVGAIWESPSSAVPGSARVLARFVNQLVAAVRVQRPKGVERVRRRDPGASSTGKPASAGRLRMSPRGAAPAAPAPVRRTAPPNPRHRSRHAAPRRAAAPAGGSRWAARA